MVWSSQNHSVFLQIIKLPGVLDSVPCPNLLEFAPLNIVNLDFSSLPHLGVLNVRFYDKFRHDIANRSAVVVSLAYFVAAYSHPEEQS